MPHPLLPFAQMLNELGDGVSGNNLTGNYSDAGLGSTYMHIAPADGEIYSLSSLTLHMTDTGGSFGSGDYGTGSGLTNGITFQFRQGSTVLSNLTGGYQIKGNATLVHMFNNWQIIDLAGTGDDHIHAECNFSHVYGGPIVLAGELNQSFGVLLNDDLSGLSSHHMIAKGFKQGKLF